ASGARVLAVDIPSGLDCDMGRPLGATVRAQHTVTFVAPKKGFAEPAAREWLGVGHVVGIGAPRAALTRARAKPPRRETKSLPDGHRNQAGLRPTTTS